MLGMKRRSMDHIGESDEEVPVPTPTKKKVKLDEPIEKKVKEPTEKEKLETYIKCDRTI
jgi:hypothetical protein